jgi:hypothetical protein
MLDIFEEFARIVLPYSNLYPFHGLDCPMANAYRFLRFSIVESPEVRMVTVDDAESELASFMVMLTSVLRE